MDSRDLAMHGYRPPASTQTPARVSGGRVLVSNKDLRRDRRESRRQAKRDAKVS